MERPPVSLIKKSSGSVIIVLGDLKQQTTHVLTPLFDD